MIDGEPASNVVSYAPWVMPFVNAVVSGFVAYYTATYVAKRSARKQAFSDLLGRLDDLESCAEALFLVSGADPTAHALYRGVCTTDSRLGRRITEVFEVHQSRARLAGPDPVPPAITAARIALRQMITDDRWVDAARPAVLGNDQRFNDLRTCVDKFRRALREEAQDLKADDLQA